MVRDNRIKEYIFPAFAVNGSNIGPTYSDHVLNGELIKIRVEGINSPGSLIILESGTAIEHWRRNGVTSGLAVFEVYPAVFQVDSTNTSIGSPNFAVSRIVNNQMAIVGSGFTSGTAKTFGPVTYFYR